jgi:hypothetical protein
LLSHKLHTQKTAQRSWSACGVELEVGKSVSVQACKLEILRANKKIDLATDEILQAADCLTQQPQISLGETLRRQNKRLQNDSQRASHHTLTDGTMQMRCQQPQLALQDSDTHATS